MPYELDRLFRSRSEDALHFRVYSRLYNNLFAFSALGGNIDCKTHKGIYVFRLHGQIYHFLPDLLPNEQGRKYLQLYFFDSQQEHQQQSGIFQELRPDMIRIIMDIMDRNPYARFFRSLEGQNIDESTTIRINKNPCLDQRVFNAPTTDEVAAIWSDRSAVDENEGPYIAVSGKSNVIHRIRHYYGCYDPLQYPLLFPHGESGWHPGIPRSPRHCSGNAHPPTVPTRAPLPPIQQAATEAEVLDAEETCKYL